VKIWVISSSYPAYPAQSSHAGVLARDLALCFRESGHDVAVVTQALAGGIVMDPGLRLLELRWFRPDQPLAELSPRRPLDLLRMATLLADARRRLPAAARRDPPDAVIALWALPCGIFARWVRRAVGAPYAVWLLGSDVWKAHRIPAGVRSLRRVLADAAGRFADGRELAERARRLTGIAVEFLPSVRRLPPPSGEAEACDVLFVGRYHPNKGPDVLLEAFAEVVRKRPGTSLHLHGAGALRPRLEARRQELGLEAVVKIAEPIGAGELAAALRAAKVLAIPSRIESIPLILGDAAQAGVTVVACDVGDMAEVVERAGLGFVVPAADPRALAERLLDVLRGGLPAATPGARGIFSLEAAAQRLLESIRGSLPAGTRRDPTGL
jgi:glycosyltransferase involved in cell wall biosynthesis